ncbi:hypothetical protein [Streptomyces sp. NPDC101455]
MSGTSRPVDGPAPFLGIDADAGVAQGMAHLVRAGHRRIGMPDSARSRRR